MTEHERYTVTLEKQGRWTWYFNVRDNETFHTIRSGFCWGKERARKKAVEATSHPERFLSQMEVS